MITSTGRSLCCSVAMAPPRIPVTCNGKWKFANCRACHSTASASSASRAHRLTSRISPRKSPMNSICEERIVLRTSFIAVQLRAKRMVPSAFWFTNYFLHCAIKNRTEHTEVLFGGSKISWTNAETILFPTLRWLVS